ncbi:MAG: PAS domain-containing protein [Proteobacteria bacterium]|nr:PAS domain-containing protein [Pseudomonadota bacterium]MBU1686962.1 PAS domain-containing protein [Pseudomonadota bacterium]
MNFHISSVELLTVVLVLIGTIFMSWSIFAGLRLKSQVSSELRTRWRMLIGMMGFFVFGYLLFAVVLVTGVAFPIEVLVGSIMLAGAIFVFGVMVLTHFTVSSLNVSRQGVQLSNEQLQISNDLLAVEIDEREMTRRALQEAKRYLENILDNISPLCITNLSHDILDANKAYYEIFGARPAAGPFKCYESRPGSTCHSARCPMERILAGESEVNCESVKRGYLGRDRFYMITARPFRDEFGKLSGIIESFQEVTLLKQAESALAEEKERLQVTLESIADGVITTNIGGRVVLINKTAQRLVGLSQVQAEGLFVAEIMTLLDGQDRRRVLSPVSRILDSEISAEVMAHALLLTSDQWERQISYSASPIYSVRREIIGVVLVFQDITEKVKVEAEMVKVQRLESIGVLAGGIAHDFNNILTAVMNNLALARLAEGNWPRVTARLEATEKALLRARELTSQFLTFAKGGAPIKKVISMVDLVRDSVEFALGGSNVRYELTMADELFLVEVDPGQIHQVINNLVMNADQAMPNGGRLYIGMENHLIEEKEKSILAPGRYLKIVFHDEGKGIDEGDLPLVFDPYFSTKPGGSGLGLATVYSIIARHGGHVFVESDGESGSTFIFYLPASDTTVLSNPALPVSSETAGDRPAAPVNARILVMDDQAEIREVLTDLLAFVGFQVVAVSNGEEAVRVYRMELENGTPFTGVIMDLTIPGGMGGEEAIRLLKQLDPEIRAIVSSGYSTDPVMAEYERYGFVGRVVKPYQPDELIRILREKCRTQQ